MDLILLDSVEDYVRALSSSLEISKILEYCRRQAGLAYVIREPVSKALGAGLYEIRPGPHRLVFIFHEGKIIMIHAFRKKSQRTPNSEILAASKARDRYFRSEGL